MVVCPDSIGKSSAVGKRRPYIKFAERAVDWLRTYELTKIDDQSARRLL